MSVPVELVWEVVVAIYKDDLEEMDSFLILHLSRDEMQQARHNNAINYKYSLFNTDKKWWKISLKNKK